MDNLEELLPIGTKLKVKDSEIQFMIVGYNINLGDVYYDYVAVIHPIGYEAIMPGIEKNIFYFNKEDVDEVYSVGFLDEKTQSVRKHVNNLIMARKARKEGKKSEK